MGFGTFQVVTWISAINIRHPWFVSSLIHKMPTPPPEVSCASGGLLQPQRTRSRQVALFQLPEEINEQKNENSNLHTAYMTRNASECQSLKITSCKSYIMYNTYIIRQMQLPKTSKKQKEHTNT